MTALVSMEEIEKRAEQVLPSGCMIWMGAHNGRYGKIGRRRKGKHIMIFAHRAAYEAANGPIPEGMFVLHRCDEPMCVNPDHLFLGTHKDNMADMREKRRFPSGDDHFNARMTEGKVRAAVARHNAGEPVSRIASDMGVSRSCIDDIVKGRTWSWLIKP